MTTENQISQPNGMVEVTKEQFFAALDADARDIMPSVAEPYTTRWETKSRELWGWNPTGWKGPFGQEEKYFIYPKSIVAERRAS